MNHQFEKQMGRHEIFNDLHITPDNALIIRVEFASEYTLSSDVSMPSWESVFYRTFINAAKSVMKEEGGALGFVDWDAASIMFSPNSGTVCRPIIQTISRILSSFVSYANCAFTAHVFVAAHSETVADYISWRQNLGYKSMLRKWVALLLQKSNLCNASSMDYHDIVSTLVNYGVHLHDIPLELSRGKGLVWHDKKMNGFNPKTLQVTTYKRRVVEDIIGPDSDNAITWVWDNWNSKYYFH